MTIFSRATALALLCATACRLCAADQTVIRDIRIENKGGFGRLDAQVILMQLGLKRGDQLKQVEVDRDIKNLLKTGLYADVEAVVETGTNGLVLVYKVTNRYRLVAPENENEAVEVNGAVKLGTIGLWDWMFSSKNAARRGAAVVRKWLVLAGDMIDSNILAACVAKVGHEYREELFYAAAVTARIEVVDRELGTARIVVDIKEGDRSGIDRFYFDGRKVLDEGSIRTELDLPAWWNPFYWWVRQTYARDLFARYQEQLQNLYYNRGFLQAEVGKPYTTQKGKDVALHIPIKEGPRFTVRNIELRDVTVFAEKDVRRSLAAVIDRGAIAAKSSIEAGRSALVDYYESRGYLDTKVAHALQPFENSIDVIYTIKAGALTKINMVYIQGQTYTKDKVIRRELLVRPGDIYDGVKVRTSKNRVANLGFFNSVSYDIQKPEGETKDNRRDLVFRVEESGTTGTILVGVGASSLDNLYGFATLTLGNFDIGGWPNFKGGGQKLKFSALAGSTKQEYAITFIEPWLFDRKLSLSIKPYFNKYDYTSYDQKKYGFAVGFGKSIELPRAVDPLGLTRNLRADLTYQLENSEISSSTDTNVYTDEEGQIVSFGDQEHLLSSLELSISRDMRNDSYQPSSGWKTELSGTIYGGLLGGDADLYAVNAEASIYFSLPFKHILGIYAHAKVIDTWGETEDVPLSERLFMYGYDMNVRGFKPRYIGPKAWPTGATKTGTNMKAAGGQSLGVVNAEYTMPIISKILRLALFLDCGNVWYDPWEFDLDEVALSAGVGLRFTVKNFPLRLDYAWPLESDDEYTPERNFSFSLRYDF